MNLRHTTVSIILTSLAILILWDVYVVAMSHSSSGNTISEVIRDACMKRPMIAFALGALVGHFLWP